MRLPLRLLQGAATALSPAGPRARLLIMTFHRVLPAPDPMLRFEIDRARFGAQLDLLGQYFNILRLDEACERMRAGELPARALCLTFDDGYASNVTEALPELQSRGLPGTFFIATAFLNGGRMFNDTVIETVRRLESPVDLEAFGLASARLDDMDSRRNLVGKILKEVKYLEPGERDEWVTRFAALAPGSLPDDLMMTDDQVRQLHSAGMEVGGHTHNHPILARVGPDEARTEIDQGRDRLQTITGAPVVSFAYPNGIPGVDYLDMHPLLLQEMGWRQAVTTAWGSVRADSDWLQLPRISPWDRTPLRLVARLVRSYLQAPGRTV